MRSVGPAALLLALLPVATSLLATPTVGTRANVVMSDFDKAPEFFHTLVTLDEHTIEVAAAAAAAGETAMDNVLVCRVRGFYPFPAGVKAHGPFAFIFKDTHQAIEVRTACGTDRLRADFMTAGGQAHPVWWDERARWHVLFGGSIDGHVRIKNSGTRVGSSPTLQRLRAHLEDYDPRMNLYANNCRVFCCRARREVVRINAEAESGPQTARAVLADARLAVGVLRAGVLPALYPLSILALCWEGIKDL